VYHPPARRAVIPIKGLGPVTRQSGGIKPACARNRRQTPNFRLERLLGKTVQSRRHVVDMSRVGVLLKPNTSEACLIRRMARRNELLAVVGGADPPAGTRKLVATYLKDQLVKGSEGAPRSPDEDQLHDLVGDCHW
jgi:hypothetical protein